MLKQRARILAASIFLLDLSLVAVAFVIAWWLRSEVLTPAPFDSSLYPLTTYLPLMPLALGIWGVLFLLTRRYRSHRTVPLMEEAWEVVRVCFTGAVVFVLSIYAMRLDRLVLGDDEISRSWILLFAGLSAGLLVSEKLALRMTSRYVRSHGLNFRTVLIVGTGTPAAEVVDSIHNHSYWGFKILGFIGQPGSVPPAELSERYPVLGNFDDIPDIVENNIVDDVIFAISRRDLDAMEELVLSLQEQGIRTRFAMNFLPHAKTRVELDDLDGIPILTVASGPNNVLHLMGKRALDVMVSAALLLLCAPLMAAVALVIRLTSRGDVVFQQTRCGLNGRLFRLYKFRTMVADAEERRRDLLHLNEMDGPVFKLKSDPRVTGFGRLLRRFSLDELPQLWNVLKGDMSLVGPRPPIPEEVAQYQRWQRRRLSMKPGLTCLWQISGRNQVDFDRWMELDLEYIDTWSPSLDFKILLKTIPVVLSGKGAS